MNSEKVKKIKKALDCNADCKNYNRLPYTDGHKCKTVGFWDILTYINELETKNEVLCVELSRYTENCIEMKNGTLKQFAERLKEKAISPIDLEDCVIVEDIDETLKEFEL